MKIEKINKRIEEIDRTSEQTINETNQQIKKLEEDLVDLSARIEETYRSGDITKGQELAEQKAVTESKIKFLKTFLEKRRVLPLITEEESKKLRSSLNDELFNVFHEQKRKADAVMKELGEISGTLNQAIIDTQKCGNNIIRLSKTKECVYSIDAMIINLHSNLDRFVAMYKNYLDFYNKNK